MSGFFLGGSQVLGGGGGVPDGGAAATGTAAPRLESIHNNRKYEPTGRVFIKPCHCRCRTCPSCGPRYGWRVRQRLLQSVELFKRPGLFTLTIDRAPFGEPVDAFIIITQEGYIRRLMRLLGVTLWAWTLEFQMLTGDGWPHWHLVIEIPPGGLDLKRAWHLWRDKWGLGGLDLKDKSGKSAEHALMYVTKYLTKYPTQGFPAWVLEFNKRIRFVGACRAIGRLVSDQIGTKPEAPAESDEAEKQPRLHRPLAIRMAECDKVMNFFREVKCGEEIKFEFFGCLPGEIVEAGKQGKGKIVIHQSEDEPPHIIGEWEKFGDLTEQILTAANDHPGKCDYRWSTRGRITSMRRIIATNGKEGGNV